MGRREERSSPATPLDDVLSRPASRATPTPPCVVADRANTQQQVKCRVARQSRGCFVCAKQEVLKQLPTPCGGCYSVNPKGAMV